MATPKLKRILVAIKPREHGLPLGVSQARILAQEFDAEISLVSCVFDSQVQFGLINKDPAAISAQSGMIEGERNHLEELAQSLRDWGATVATHVAWSAPAYEGILHEVRNVKADLLVVGIHRSTPVPHTFLTDIDWQLMRLCPCPLLVVKNPGLAQYETVLAAVDPLHRHAEPAGLDRAVLEMARELGRASGAELRVVNAFPNPADYDLVSSVEVLPGVFYGNENIEAVHRQAVVELVDNYGITAKQAILRPGEPATVIAEAVLEHDIKLLIVGATKRGRIEAAVLGGTAENVVAEVACDVLLVKTPSN